MLDGAASPSPMLLAAALLAALVTAVALIGASGQKVHRGSRLWIAAHGLLAVGLALLLAGPGDAPAQWLGRSLLLQWPVVVLLGMRRFHGRQPPPGTPGLDLALLALAALAVLAETAIDGATPVWSGAMALLHGYAATLLAAAPTTRDSPAQRLLAGGLAVASLVFGGFALLGAHEGLDVLAVAAPATALLALTMGFVGLLLTHERTVRELQASRRRLRHLANIDMLTQVPNRRHFGELARRVLQRQPERSGTVVMFDIDHFKHINDAHGHAAGDRALRLVSQCVQDTLRADDVAGRHGGDEFVLLLPGTDLRAAMGVATRIVRRAQELATGQGMARLSLSFGMVQLRSDETLDEAMRRADQALYEAKRQGRGRAVSADGDEQRPVFVESRRLGLT
ncbi:MAG: GGDEF domain-containing protein [Burkholderiaceae bacterium]|jgi:diguanylate cyclase (GGDEF)-like protein|nr:GGDEF domain-containing protein [Burkholderiaceae bacterium]